jgi:hypothetical protein
VNEDNKGKKRQSNAEKPISLKPLKFDEAVSDLLKVKPLPKSRKDSKVDIVGSSHEDKI